MQTTATNEIRSHCPRLILSDNSCVLAAASVRVVAVNSKNEIGLVGQSNKCCFIAHVGLGLMARSPANTQNLPGLLLNSPRKYQLKTALNTMIKTKSTPIVIRIKQPPTPKQKAPKLTYFKVDLAITFARCAFMCKDDSQEAVYELFDGFGIPLPDSWDIGFDADRPFAETITAFVTIYAAIPKTEADHLTNAQVGNQVKAAVAVLLNKFIESK
jgi:hypothetical protein